MNYKCSNISQEEVAYESKKELRRYYLHIVLSEIDTLIELKSEGKKLEIEDLETLIEQICDNEATSLEELQNPQFPLFI